MRPNKQFVVAFARYEALRQLECPLDETTATAQTLHPGRPACRRVRARTVSEFVSIRVIRVEKSNVVTCLPQRTDEGLPLVNSPNRVSDDIDTRVAPKFATELQWLVTFMGRGDDNGMTACGQLVENALKMPRLPEVMGEKKDPHRGTIAPFFKWSDPRRHRVPALPLASGACAPLCVGADVRVGSGCFA